MAVLPLLLVPCAASAQEDRLRIFFQSRSGSGASGGIQFYDPAPEYTDPPRGGGRGS